MKESKKENTSGAAKKAKSVKTGTGIIHNIKQGALQTDSNFKIIDFNGRLKTFFFSIGLSLKKGIYYKTFFESFADKFKLSPKMIEGTLNKIENKEFVSIEFNCPINGENKQFNIMHTPLSEGGFLLILTDISEEKNFGAVSSENIAETDRFFSLTIDLLCIADMKADFVRLNNTWENVLGYKVEELVGKNFYQFIHPEDVEDTMTAVSNLSKGKIVLNFINRYRCKDGSYRWLEWKASPFENKLIYAAARDITDRISFEEILRQNEEKYRFLTENVGDMIWQIDRDYNYIYVSPSVENILGYMPEEIMGESIFSLLTPSSADYLSQIEERNKNEYIFSPLKGGVYDLQHIRKDGSLVWCEVHSSPLYTPDGRLIFSQGVTRDINARKDAERKLKDYAAELKDLNATKDRFFSIISHDLKSPFNGLIGMTLEFKNNAQDYSYQEISTIGSEMHEAVVNTYRLLENLLEWSRIQLDQIQLVPSMVPLNEEVEKIITSLNISAAQKNIKLINCIDKNVIVYADLNMLKVILRNLISNAIKFTGRGGFTEIGCVAKDSSSIIYVKDNGVGIPEEIKKKLFRADSMYSSYGTEKEKGTGLGLLLCKEFVEKHNGKIWVESQPGNGSKFIFSLPFKI